MWTSRPLNIGLGGLATVVYVNVDVACAVIISQTAGYSKAGISDRNSCTCIKITF